MSRTDPVGRAAAAEYAKERDGIFLDAASFGLVPSRSVRAAGDLAGRRNRVGGFDEEELGRALRRCRSAVAALLEVEPSEVTLAPNTSYGINLGAALAAATRPPGTILVSRGEFPANVYPWMALRERGFSVDIVPEAEPGLPDVDRLMARVHDDDVRVLALSAVQYASGYLADIAAFGRACRARGVLFVVDAIQALGAVPLQPASAGVDLLASGGQKWLCGPWGSGFVWMDPRHLDAFDPPMVSWLAMRDALEFQAPRDYRWDLVEDGRRFELATLGIQDHLGLAHSLELFLEMGAGPVREHIHRLHRPVLEWAAGQERVRLVTPADPAHRAGILSFTLPDVAGRAADLRAAGVHFAVREGMIRLAPHFYNSLREMETVVSVLEGAGRRD